MNTLPCPICNGTGEQREDSLTGIDGDTSYDTIEAERIVRQYEAEHGQQPLAGV